MDGIGGQLQFALERFKLAGHGPDVPDAALVGRDAVALAGDDFAVANFDMSGAGLTAANLEVEVVAGRLGGGPFLLGRVERVFGHRREPMGDEELKEDDEDGKTGQDPESGRQNGPPIRVRASRLAWDAAPLEAWIGSGAERLSVVM